MNQDMQKLAGDIQAKQAERAKFVSENAQHIAPIGQRSAALQLRDAQIYLALLDAITISGKKTTADEREAMFEEQKAINAERQVLEKTMHKTNEMLALLDAEIEYLRRCFEAYKVG